MRVKRFFRFFCSWLMCFQVTGNYLLPMQALSVSKSLMSVCAPYAAVMQPGGRPPKSTAPDIGQRIAAARRRADISQAKLAEMLGVTQQTIGTLERRTSAPRTATVVKIAEALGVSPNELLGLDQPKPAKIATKGRLQSTFEEVGALARSDQVKILEVVGDMLAARRARKAS
jgi:transcriptional regulator with XRE-family HTH domain